MFISPFIYRNIGGPVDQSTTGGGGGDPLGVSTIWNTTTQSPLAYPTWASLSGISSPRQQDEAFVVDIDGLGSQGFARWDSSGSVWRLIRANFVSQTAMYTFPEPIWPDCTAVCAENPTRAYTYPTLTGPDSVARGFWLPLDIANSTPVVAAFLMGDENGSAARLARGFTDSTTAGASITGDIAGTGYTRLAITATGTKNAQLTTLVSSVTAFTKTYIRFRCQVSASGAVGAGSIHGAYVADGANISYPRQYGITQSFGFLSGASSILSPAALRGTGGVLPETDTWIEYYDDGRSVLTYIYLNGVLYHVEKRSSSISGSNLVALIMGGINAPSNSHTDVRDVVVTTFS